MRKAMLYALAILLVPVGALAQVDTLKVAVSQRGFWDSSFVEFAQKEGFLKQAGLDVDLFYTDGGAQTLTAVTSGSVDIGMSNGLLGAVGAYAKGAPLRAVSAQMTGAHELYWYVRADSPIQNLKDADGKSVAFSSPGSSSNLILLSLLKQAGSKAKPVATGGLPGTHTQVMTGQIDIGWAAPPFGLQDAADGKIRIIARSREATELRDQTIRVNIVHPDRLAAKRAPLTRFMQVYAKTIDWAYENPRSIQYFAESSKVSPAIAKKAIDDFYPKAALQVGEIRDLDRTLKDALDYKYLPAPKTAQEVAGLFDILYKP
jgi:NitT/TauT family transport system substrate-binding protein